MNLYSIKVIKELLRAHETAPKEHLGQNFLLEKRVAVKMLRAAQLSPNDTVLEIGPGIGTLTKELAQKVKWVVAVEKDPAMVKILKETIKDLLNIQIIQGDILRFFEKSDKSSMLHSIILYAQFSTNYQLLTKNYKVVANLPYYITSPVIRMFLEAENKPELMVVMMQKEVAQRICVKPPMNLLAVSVQFYAEVKIISSVRKRAFWPPPKVDSAILKIVPKKEKSKAKPEQFFKVVKAGFKQPRKQLGNNLTQGLKLSGQEVETWLRQVSIAPAQRAETLSLKDWIALAKSLPKT